jgi:hypothetical protein
MWSLNVVPEWSRMSLYPARPLALVASRSRPHRDRCGVRGYAKTKGSGAMSAAGRTDAAGVVLPCDSPQTQGARTRYGWRVSRHMARNSVD